MDIPAHMTRMLHSGFLRSSEMFPDRPAVEVEGNVLSYRELCFKAASLAATLQRRTPPGGSPLTAVFAHRSATAFVGILAALFRGHGYVPLNRTFPADRTRMMLASSDCRAVIVDNESAQQLGEVLEGLNHSLLIIAPDKKKVESLAERYPSHIILGFEDLETPESLEMIPSSPESVAYLLFTSGSTGIPKGVMVAHRNVTYFVDAMVNRYGITEEDRFSQNFDMTFDLSAFDMFVAWECGACVCCPSQKTLINPGHFMRDARLTVWFSVPSVGVFMKRLGMLKPNKYPNLRWSLFCGEALPVDLTGAWADAAPNSIVENLYGPTEVTIACTLYRWDREKSVAECEFGVVPIGRPYLGTEVMVVDEKLREVLPGEQGELLLTGPQLSLGYWRDPDKTAKAFIVPEGRKCVYYRTGDRVRRPVGENPIIYLGRLDHQVKVLGHRLELGEVEAALRQETGVNSVVAMGWPITSSGAGGVVAFVVGSDLKQETIRKGLQTKLPPYAVPRQIYFVPRLPLNVNGKVDRQALRKLLEAPA
jgi:amino acid adenylation domain-containing protein